MFHSLNPISHLSCLDLTNLADLEIQPAGHTFTRLSAGTSVLSDSAVSATSSEGASKRRNKPSFAALLTRTRSIKMDDAAGRRSQPTTPSPIKVSDYPNQNDAIIESGGMRTAPLQHNNGHSFPDVGQTTIRNRSADRQTSFKNQSTVTLTSVNKDPALGSTVNISHARENNGSHLFANLKNSSSKAAGGLGKAGKGIFSKMTRSGSSTGRDTLDDLEYRFKVIILPLVEQTRKTRIAKRLEDSKDKTEFWMPALPWRCIE